ncbi:hypothetical protein BaRGS_00032609 [Batillaria attramentaria]|uniref:Uncharacterized protein n=1 Tax=Batillaria attramentaria TaxID=370345 RepID=A0ABD0JN42_9CAEN
MEHLFVTGFVLILRVTLWTDVLTASNVTACASTYSADDGEVNTLDAVVKLVRDSQLSDIALISDDDDVLQEVFTALRSDNFSKVQTEIYRVHPNLTTSSRIVQVWGTIKSYNILVLGSEYLQRRTFKEMYQLSVEMGRFSRLVLDTRWVMLVSGHVLDEVITSSLPLSNLALFVHDHVSSSAPGGNVMMWSPSERRFSEVFAPDLTFSRLFSDSSFSLHGVRLRVGINMWYPYVIKVPGGNNGSAAYTGLCMSLLRHLAQSLNFSYELVLPPDGEWGDYRDGNWTGLVGLLHRQEVDMVTAPVVVTAARSRVVEYTVPFVYWYYNLVIRKEDVGEHHMWTVFLGPFDWQIYVCIIGSFLCCTCIFAILVRGEKALQGMSPPTVSEVVQLLFRAGINQGLQETFPRFVSVAIPTLWTGGVTRALIATWCLLSLILTSCYTCRLTSLLVTVNSPPPFTSLAEMVKRDDIRWGITGGSSALTTLRHSTDTILQTMYSGLMKFATDDPEVLSLDRDVHLGKIMAGHYAYLTDTLSEKMLTMKQYLTQVPVPEMGVQMYSVMTQKNSSLTWRIEKVLLRLQDTGMLSQLRKQWFPALTDSRIKSSQTVITLATLQGPFYVAAGGILLAITAYFAERIVFRRNCQEKANLTREPSI